MGHVGDLHIPAVESFVWFTKDNVSVMGKVLSVDVTLSRPVTVHLFQPARGSRNVVMAKFRPSLDNN